MVVGQTLRQLILEPGHFPLVLCQNGLDQFIVTVNQRGGRFYRPNRRGRVLVRWLLCRGCLRDKLPIALDEFRNREHFTINFNLLGLTELLLELGHLLLQLAILILQGACRVPLLFRKAVSCRRAWAS